MMHREEWLNAMAEAILPLFAEADAHVRSKVAIVCAMDVSERTPWGKCFPVRRDNITQILVSPRIPTARQAAEVIVHELVHASVGCEHMHKAPFRRVALRVGLTGPMSAYTPAGPELAKRLESLVAQVGQYPASKIVETDEGSLNALLEHAAPCGGRIRNQGALISEARTLIKQAASLTHIAFRERRMYHRHTRECRIVYSDMEVAALGSAWWEWIPR